MIQPAFDIGHTQQSPIEGELLVEVSAQSLNFILYKKDPYQLLLLRQYRLYTSVERSTTDLILEVIESDQFMREHAGAASIVYNFPESSLVPDQYHDPKLNASMDRLIYGEAGNEMIFEERVAGLGMYNVYRIPREIHSVLKEKFSGGRCWHFYSLMLTAPYKRTGTQENVLSVVFYHDKFIASLHKTESLQLIQTFRYQTPEDVAYYLLLICRQCGADLSTVDLYVSGLIDSQSALFSELLKYFPDVYEEGLPDGVGINPLLEDFPKHYFSPLLKMSLCAL